MDWTNFILVILSLIFNIYNLNMSHLLKLEEATFSSNLTIKEYTTTKRFDFELDMLTDISKKMTYFSKVVIEMIPHHIYFKDTGKFRDFKGGYYNDMPSFFNELVDPTYNDFASTIMEYSSFLPLKLNNLYNDLFILAREQFAKYKSFLENPNETDNLRIKYSDLDKISLRKQMESIKNDIIIEIRNFYHRDVIIK